MSTTHTFTDKVIIVTGASEGIGRALCVELAKQQAKLSISARNEARLTSLKDEIAHHYDDVDASVCITPTDVSEQQQCLHLIKRTLEHFERIDVLVNNAGITMWSTLEELTDLSIFQTLYQVNVMSAVYLSHAAIPHLKQTKGMIVGVSSMAGLVGVPTRTGYAASKHAMFGFLDSLRIELMDSGISVVGIAPDFVVTEIHKRALDPNGKPLGKSPMQQQKIMTSETCAQLIVTAMQRKSRLAVLSFRGKLGRWLKLLWPTLMDRLAQKVIDQKH